MKKVIITLLTFLIFNISFGKPIKPTKFSTWLTGSNSYMIKPNMKNIIKKAISIEYGVV